MKIIEIEQKDIINKQDFENGNLILLTGRPCIGKTWTCCDLFKYYSKSFSCLYFDLSGENTCYFFNYKNPKGLVNEYMTSAEIIKEIQFQARHNAVKIVFIDYWQLLNDNNEWFLKCYLN